MCYIKQILFHICLRLELWMLNEKSKVTDTRCAFVTTMGYFTRSLLVYSRSRDYY